jgi:hypothetical protein
MLRVSVAAVLIAVVVPQAAPAQTPLPPIVTKGLTALQEQRCRDAVDIWTVDWQWPRDTERRQRLMATCDFLSEVGASLHGYDLYRVIYVTPHLARIFIVLRYERHPLYLAVTAYSPTDPDWRVTEISWDRDPEKVFPPVLDSP